MNYNKRKNNIVKWIREYFEENGKDSKCVIGISGGKDSAVVAALCVEALGTDRIIGVEMPCGYQEDIAYADTIFDLFHIEKRVVDIKPLVDMANNMLNLSNDALVSIKARIRMIVLYGIAQTVGGRVANTSNYSERYLGYFTRFGDAAGDFSPLGNLTVSEVKEIAKCLFLPTYIYEKPPSDGLSGRTDEESFGFTYDDLEKYLLSDFKNDEIPEDTVNKKIYDMHKASLFKSLPMPTASF